MQVVFSKSNIPIRITKERWDHVFLGHPEMKNYAKEILETLSNPNFIFEGGSFEKIAVKDYLNELGKFIVVVYKEVNEEDGFLVTSFLISKLSRLEKKKLIWKR